MKLHNPTCVAGRSHHFEMEGEYQDGRFVCTNHNLHAEEDVAATVKCTWCGGGWCVDCIPTETPNR